MRINRKLILIIVISGALACVFSILLFLVLRNEVQPEKQVLIPVLISQIGRDEIILEGNIRYLKINENAVPAEVIRNKESLINKKAVQKIRPGQLIYNGDIAERGEVTKELGKLYIVGIDVSNISNFLGTQLLQEGEYFIVTDQENVRVVIAGLIDSTGNAVFGDKQAPIKTINLGVKTLEDVKLLRKLESLDYIELVKFPDEN